MLKLTFDDFGIFVFPPRLSYKNKPNLINNFDLIDKLSKKFSLPKPTKISYNDKSINKNIKSFYQVSKKVYSNRLSIDLGYNLIYPKIDDFLNSLLKKELKL